MCIASFTAMVCIITKYSVGDNWLYSSSYVRKVCVCPVALPPEVGVIWIQGPAIHPLFNWGSPSTTIVAHNVSATSTSVSACVCVCVNVCIK